ncbi:uncharacterized protein EDB93DRAFT_1178652 [Suillus bovinus]|uniref:uncharacterized protein n=1 Tax=Suillus bovinus TaxID=48563 RepID=UPI001B884988|nr:uncharacterized protein EDB93DRAFT_1178652 [Suillus bovinus]KAG2131247.1 hypothetical protein EDB93DRAFT_1178652 [Suillus bovinus]
MSVPTHSIHSIHGTFAGVPSYTTFSSNAGVVIEGSPIHPSLARTAAWRLAPVSLPSSSSRRLSSFPVARRVPPPPPPRAIAPQTIPFPSENPFSDSNSCVPPIPQRPIPHRTHLASQSYTVRLPGSNPIDALVRQRTAQRAAQERETRCKVVAGILLNRVHAVGKPMRRLPPSTEAPRTYKRSRLSVTTTAEDVC